LAPKKCKGTPLKVFSGKEAKLNRIILKILEKKSPLIAYDIWRQLKAIKGHRHVDSKTAYRRMKALEQQCLIAQKGTRLGKRGGDKILYELTLRGKAELRRDEKSTEEFLRKATEEQLQKFINLFS
jgi:DNA-binding PadR family transcriptional regulator